MSIDKRRAYSERSCVYQIQSFCEHDYREEIK